MNEIKLGTIGTGSIVHDFLNGVKQTEGISPEAAYSRTEQKGRELAEAFGAKKVYTDLEELFADPEINYIYVASPNNLHYIHAKTALEHNKNVICEKPMCPQRKQVEELTALAEEKNLVLVDATPTAFLPNLDAVKELLPEVGRIRLVMSSYSQYSSRYDKLLAGEVTNVFSPDFAGGCLQDINYYNLYLNVALFGRPKKGRYYPNICHTGVDTSGIAVLQYPDFISECSGAKDTWGDNFVQIEGERGHLFIEGGANGLRNIRLVTREREAFYNRQENTDRMVLEVQHMTKQLLEREYGEIRKGLELTADVIGLMEDMRKEAGILFAGER